MPCDDYDTDAQPSPPVLDADTIAGLDPGIRDFVVWMASLGIPTSDSGDGVSKPDMECALKVPNVFAVYRDDDAPLARIHALRLARLLPEREGTYIQVTWSPRDMCATLEVIGYTNADVPL